MHRITPIGLAVAAAVALAVMPAPAADVPLGTEFTYQGRLTQAGTPVDEPVDLRVRLFDAAAAGLQIGSELEYLAVPVVGGALTIDLDFGQFGGSARWIEIDVKLAGGGAYETLAPRQPILPAPVSMFAFAAPNSGPFLFNGNDAIFDGGDVGIGTADPDSPLHVQHATGTALTLQAGGADNFIAMDGTGGTRQAILFTEGGAAQGGIQYNRFDNPDGLNFHTNGNVPRMSIDAAGDVGVGTTSPQSRLHVSNGATGITPNAGATATIESTGTNYLNLLAPDGNAQGILFGDENFVADGGIIYGNATVPNGLQFRTNGNQTRMSIDADGNVGIGITDPDKPLEVRGTSSWPLRITGPQNPGLQINADGTASSWAIYHNSATDGLNFRDSTTGATRLLITGDTGNIGIGASSPDRRLTILGTGSEYISVQAPVQSGILFGKSEGATNGGMLYNSDVADGLSFRTLNNTTKMVLDSSGDLGIGITNPQHPLHVIPSGDGDGNGQPDGPGVVVSGENGATAYLGIDQDGIGEIGSLTSNLNIHADGTRVLNVQGGASPKVGIAYGNIPPAALALGDGSLWIGGSDSGALLPWAGPGIRIFNNDADGKSTIYAYDYTANTARDLHLGTGDTRVSVPTLEIRGGADLVEGFETTDDAVVEPGTVMVIDPAHPGALAVSAGAYDTKVAGVVSGAGGVRPGIHLGQDGVMDGDTKVAMTGRVYVQCTAANGAIAPGDLLTTADRAGHAMKATDRDRSHGAVIGKAMSTLDEGTGLVLVLVNLQ